MVGILPLELENECPFAHEPPEAILKTELGGVGTTLGDNMGKGIGVHTKAPPVGVDYTNADIDRDPRDRPGEAKLSSVQIQVKGETVMMAGRPLDYPLTCAAHHLIPAQEALKEHPILQFMCKDGEDQDFMNNGKKAPAPAKNSKVWGNVGYNVNGGQNGVWLPGNYAVGAGTAGVEVWKNRASEKRRTYTDQQAADNWIKALDFSTDEWAQLYNDPEEQEDKLGGAKLAEALTSASLPQYMLAGKNFEIDEGNPKWAYVLAAMDASDGFFHDRHEEYSEQVKKYLGKIHEVYKARYDQSTNRKNPCPKCEKASRPDGAKESLVGPAYNIVNRLVCGSSFFKKYVKANQRKNAAINIYTSRWVLEYMKSLKKPKALQE